MIEWLYLVWGIAVFSLLSAKKRKKKEEPTWLSSTKLLLALAAVLGIDWLLNTFLWQPAGRDEFRITALLLLTFLMGEAEERIFVPLAGFSLWMMIHEKTLSFPVWLAAGLAFPFAAALLKTLLESLLKHLRLADVPSVFQGWPMVFWLASLLALALPSWVGVVRLFVN